MKMWLRSWHTPRRSANACGGGRRHMGRIGVVDRCRRAGDRAGRGVASRRFGLPEAARASCASAMIAASAWVSGVSRRNRVGGKRSMASRTTPLVSCVSTTTVDGDAEVVDRAIGGEGVGDVAVGILLLVEPAVGRHVDAPIDDVLAVMVARRQAQRLDHAGRRRVIVVTGLVAHPDAHAATSC